MIPISASRARRAAKKVGGFGASVLVSGLAGLAVIPVIISFAGADGWASIAVGQTLGALIAVVTGLGWLQTGPTEVARATRAERAQHYRDSLTLRLSCFVLMVPLAVVITVFLRPPDPIACSLAAIATALTACGAAWFFIGTGLPAQLLLFDTLPRVLSLAAGALAASVTASAVPVAICLLLGAAVAVSSSTLAISKRVGSGRRRSFKENWRVLSRQIQGLGIGVFSAIYLTAPLLLVAAVHPSATPSYALADRIKQQAMTVVGPVSQALQGWVPTAASEFLSKRVRTTAQLGILLGFGATVSFAACAPLVGTILGAGTIGVPLALSVPLGIAFGLNVTTLILGASCLIPLNATRVVLMSASCGAAAAVPLMLLGSSAIGSAGIAWGVAGAQATVAAVQLVGLQRALQRPS